MQRAFSGSRFESLFGFCRAVRVGDYIHVSGTAPILDGKTAPGDARAQSRRCFEIIESALKQFGADRNHVVRTRMFLTNIQDWQAVGAAHAEFFSAVQPAATMVGTSALIEPDWLVEIEADAYFPERT
ncbi:MAG: RidA family protein [Acidobacteriales bacterium]|nr:RidA family protein [Terriglobales bacterium]